MMWENLSSVKTLPTLLVMHFNIIWSQSSEKIENFLEQFFFQRQDIDSRRLKGLRHIQIGLMIGIENVI